MRLAIDVAGQVEAFELLRAVDQANHRMPGVPYDSAHHSDTTVDFPQDPVIGFTTGEDGGW